MVRFDFNQMVSDLTNMHINAELLAHIQYFRKTVTFKTEFDVENLIFEITNNKSWTGLIFHAKIRD